MKNKKNVARKPRRIAAVPVSQQFAALHAKLNLLTEQVESLEARMTRRDAPGEKKLIEELEDGMPGVACFPTR